MTHFQLTCFLKSLNIKISLCFTKKNEYLRLSSGGYNVLTTLKLHTHNNFPFSIFCEQDSNFATLQSEFYKEKSKFVLISSTKTTITTN